jgi:aspartate/glutamate/glutamine transport system substrate-binding protein
MALVGEFLLVSPATSGQSERAAAPPATRLEPRTRLLLATASLVAVFLVGVAVWASSTSSVPQWAFDKKTVYLGEKIPLAWTYKLPASSAPVQFEIESGAAGKFQSEWCTDAEHHFVNRVNATREWRVRAVADCVSKTPVSSWSRSIEITQYDNIYQRIKARGQVDVFASQSQDQDFFKWSSNEGFDIDLANVIVRDLSSLMNRPLKLHLRTVKWENLLPAAGDTSTDFAISSITKKPWREDKFSIQFTDSYYCTGYALVFRAGMQDGRIADMIKGKVVGVQAETTSATLVGHLATGGLFTVRSFDTNEHLQNELVASKIDFGVTDTAFAQSAQLDTEGQLKFKQFGPDDLTATKDEPIQEYAIAVHRGETELLRAINQTLARVKGDSEMTRLYASATARYEEVKKYAPGSRSVGPRPWECYGQTASGN